MQPATKTKADELIEEMNRIRQLPRSEQELPLKKVEQQTHNLLEHDAVGAYCVLGMIASLKRDIENIYSSFDKALRLVPSDLRVLDHFGTSLANAYHFRESIDYHVQSYEPVKGDKRRLDKLIRSFALSGFFSKALPYIAEAEDLKLDKLLVSSDLTKRAASTLSTLKIQEDLVADLIEMSVKLLEDNQICLDGIHLVINDNESIEIELVVDETKERVRMLQDGLEDLEWERGLSAKLRDKVAVFYCLNHSPDNLEEQLDKIEEQLKDPKNMIPLDSQLMSEVDELVRDVEV
jgi:hypothetical protein